MKTVPYAGLKPEAWLAAVNKMGIRNWIRHYDGGRAQQYFSADL